MMLRIFFPSLVCGLLFLWCVQIQGQQANLPTNLRNRHVELLSKLSHYELVRPYRSTHEGEHLTHDLSTEAEEDHHDYQRAKRETIRRRKRDAGLSSTYSGTEWNETNEPDQPHFNFAVDAFGEKFTLDLVRNLNIASPTFRVTMNMEDGEKVTYRPRTNCFYTGHVKNSIQSTVAISNCDGLEGLIKADDEEYIIEPLETPSETTTNITEGHVHIMYRRKDWKGDGGYYNYTHPQLFDDEMFPDSEDSAQEPDAPSSGRHKRQDISSYDREHHIEVLIVADYAVRSFHGDSAITNYLMTMFHIVNLAFSHPTLMASIDLTVVNIILLNSGESENMVVENNPGSSLSNICNYAHSQSSPDETYWAHFDYMAFLTRVKFGPAGYAPVTGMCSSYRSCSLTHDEGILTAFVVSHETGHVLGMEHDGQGRNQCVEESTTGSIMAPVVSVAYNNYFWSDCSRNELHGYLWRYECLWDVPYDSSRTYIPVEGFPGERFTMDDQCRFDFGEDWGVCIFWDDTNPCDVLLCNQPADEYWCKTRRSPPLDGTECDTDMWCMHGECVFKTVIDGQWSDWSAWSECSYDCDVGAQYRTRECNNPPPERGGTPCEGDDTEYKLCNTQDCEVRQDRRAVQCEEDFGNWEFKGTRHSWQPFENRNKTLACKLTCISRRTQDVVMSEYNVRDGTPCSYDDHESICINGDCIPIGCNKDLEDPIREDICGVCGGDNTKCDLIKGSFVEIPKGSRIDINSASTSGDIPVSDKGSGEYQLILNIPAGARNIEIKDMNGAKHFLAMKVKGQNYILNKKKKQSPSYDFIFIGSRFVYVNEEREEMLWSKGPILEKVSLALFWTDDPKPANITYQYHINLLESNTVPKEPLPTESNTVPEVEPVPTESNTVPEVESVPTESNEVPEVEPVPTESSTEPEVEPVPTESNTVPEVEPVPTESSTEPEVEPVPTESNTEPEVEPVPTKSNEVPVVEPVPTESSTEPEVEPVPTESNEVPVVEPVPTESNTEPEVEPVPTESNTEPEVEPVPTESNEVPVVEPVPTESNTEPEVEPVPTESITVPEVEPVTTESNTVPEEEPVTTESITVPEVEPVQMESNTVPEEEPVPTESNTEPEVEPVPTESNEVPEVEPVPTESNTTPGLDPELIIPDVGTNPKYVWEAIGWTECTKSCGGGKTFYRYQCRVRNSKKRVKVKKCGQKSYSNKGIARDCNTQPCDDQSS